MESAKSTNGNVEINKSLTEITTENTTSIKKDIVEQSSTTHPEKMKIPFVEIIDYLNKKTNKKYKPGSKTTQKLIKARFEEGFTFDDFKLVIDTKVNHWLNDETMNDFLRPTTLFGTKFESYLNQKPKQQKSKIASEEEELERWMKENGHDAS